MGILYIVSTPIGNISDLSIRAIETLMTVPVIACEDTRVTGHLLGLIRERYPHLIPQTSKSTPHLISFYDETEGSKIPEIVDHLEQDDNIALVSDAGTPLLSDPGYKLVQECIRRKIQIMPVPGPSSITTALSISGLPTQPFWFYGYLPDSSNKRIKLLQQVKENILSLKLKPTLEFFASPHRLQSELTDIKAVFGDVSIVVCRELTKLHEEVFRGKISEAVSHFHEPKGEFVILFRI
jgi:16S rRNA (cytidine1402-2'-O)-methyltransferase